MKIQRVIERFSSIPKATLMDGEVDNYITQVYATIKLIETDENNISVADKISQYSMGFPLTEPSNKRVGNFVDPADFVVPEEVMARIDEWWNAEETINKVKEVFLSEHRKPEPPTFPEATEEDIEL